MWLPSHGPTVRRRGVHDEGPDIAVIARAIGAVQRSWSTKRSHRDYHSVRIEPATAEDIHAPQRVRSPRARGGVTDHRAQTNATEAELLHHVPEMHVWWKLFASLAPCFPGALSFPSNGVKRSRKFVNIPSTPTSMSACICAAVLIVYG